MLIPSIIVKKSRIDSSGYGIFSKTYLLKGTVIWLPCEHCEVYSTEQMKSISEHDLFELDEYGYYLNDGTNILPCNQAHLLNHSCIPNVLDFGLDFGIAIADIQPNEEITIDYGTFIADKVHNDWTVNCNCNNSTCRKIISPRDYANSTLQNVWRSKITEALKYIGKVEQPLHEILLKNSSIYPLLLKENFEVSNNFDLNKSVTDPKQTLPRDAFLYS
jgi:hypothetical protein